MKSPFASSIPLTSIERMHFLDSSAEYPNRIACRILINQTLDLQLAKTACFWLGERHQVLGCSIREIQGRLYWHRDPDLYWVEPPDTNEKSTSPSESNCHWFRVERCDRPPSTGPDFVGLLGSSEFYRPCMLIRQWKQEPGKQESVSATTPATEVNEIWLSIHHAFCDGAGGIQIISDWIQIYENLVAGLEPCEGLPTMDQNRFTQRNHLGLLSWKFLRVLPLQVVGLYGATKFIFRKSLELVPRKCDSDSSSDRRGMAVASTWLDKQELVSIEKASQRNDFNPNGKLLGDLFATLEDWASPRDLEAGVKEAAPVPSRSGHWIRIIVPINLREIGDRRLPAANRSSLIQVDRRNAVPTAEFYRSIQREIGIVLRFQLDRMFLIMIRLLSLSDGMLKRAVRRQKPRGLAVFTNLGRPFRRIERRTSALESTVNPLSSASLLQLQEFDFLAPIRYGTPLNFTLAQFQGRMRITLHFDPGVITIAQAKEVLERYRMRLTGTLDVDFVSPKISPETAV